MAWCTFYDTREKHLFSVPHAYFNDMMNRYFCPVLTGNIGVTKNWEVPPLHGWGKGKQSKAIESYSAYLKKVTSALVMSSSCACCAQSQGDGHDSNPWCSRAAVPWLLLLCERLEGCSHLPGPSVSGITIAAEKTRRDQNTGRCNSVWEESGMALQSKICAEI